MPLSLQRYQNFSLEPLIHRTPLRPSAQPPALTEPGSHGLVSTMRLRLGAVVLPFRGTPQSRHILLGLSVLPLDGTTMSQRAHPLALCPAILPPLGELLMWVSC